MKVEYIQLLEDNYCYLIINKKKGMLVDPAVAEPVIDYLQKSYPEIAITHILATHKHWDHVGEVDQLLEKLQEFNANKNVSKIEVISGLEDKIASSSILIDKLTKFKVNDLEITIFCVPCHTKGHLLYLLENPEMQKSNVQDQIFHKSLFTGDTLFYGGCGRFFEGNAKEMLKNFDYIENLQDDIFIFAGHEYTVQNLQWASKVEYDNENIIKKLEWAIKQREQKLPTVPSTVADEKLTNVFMRTKNANIQEKLQLSSPEEIMAKLREMKNNNISLK